MVRTAVGELAGIASLVTDLRAQGIEVDASDRRRSEYSYDASNYRVRPAAVAFPTSVGEVRAILRACAASGIPVTTRGGGTSMAGNAVGAGLVVDVSRWMTAVGEIDPASRTLWVDAGVVLGELRSHVEKVSAGELTFAPDPSSLTRATIGGSIGNDACGNHSVAYGRMTGEFEGLILPHPQAAERKFVMGPLAEIASGWTDPRGGGTALALAERAAVGADACPQP